MTISEGLAAIGIHVLVPSIGLICFGMLTHQMRRYKIPSPPILAWFLLFATFGGWVLVFLTGLFWRWSGMATIGVCYLIFAAPVITALLAWNLRHRRISIYHRSAFFVSLGYTTLVMIVWLSFMIARAI